MGVTGVTVGSIRSSSPRAESLQLHHQYGSYALRKKTLEVDACAAEDDRIHEVHP